MPLSWNEIKTRAVTFSNKWKEEENEDAEAKSFWRMPLFTFSELIVEGLLH